MSTFIFNVLTVQLAEISVLKKIAKINGIFWGAKTIKG